MVCTGPETTDVVPSRANEPHGIVIKQQLVALGSGRATGTFRAIGTVAASGKASSDSLVPKTPIVARLTQLDGDVQMCAPGGTLTMTISAVVRLVPETGVLTGGGTWTLTDATGSFDGIRAAGASTLLLTYDSDGTVTVDVVLTGHVVVSPGSPQDLRTVPDDPAASIPAPGARPHTG